MRYLFCLLFVIASAIAQPVQGPFVVLEAVDGTALGEPRVVMNNDNDAEVFYVVNDESGDELFSLTYSLQTNQIISEPIAWASCVSDLIISIRSVAVQATGFRGVTMATGRRQPDYYHHQDFCALIETSDQIETLCTGNTDFLTYVLSPQILACSSGNWLVGWIDFEWISHGGFWSFWYQFAKFYSIEGMLVADHFVYTVYESGITRSLATEVAPDSFLYVLDNSSNMWESWIGFISVTPDTAYSEWGDNIHAQCSWNTLALGTTTSGGLRFIRYESEDSVLAVFTHSESDSCHLLNSYSLARTPDAVVYNENFGFAALLTHHHRLMIARLDTNGVEVQPLGILYEPDAEHEITDADLAIDSEGNVVTLWTERTVGENAAHQLKITSVGWDVFLDTDDDSRITPIPSSMSLSTYPNPFNSSLTITYELAKTAKVDLTVYNSLGQLVETLFAGEMNAGTHEQVWQPVSGSGVYFIRLSDQSSQKIQKVLYLK